MIAFDEVTLENGVWYFRWSYVGAVRVVLWGVLLEETSEQEFAYTAGRLHSSVTIAPPIEVIEAGEQAPSERNLPYMILQWYRIECHHYIIEYKPAATWLPFSTLPDISSVFIKTLITPLLPDQAEARWRVTALDENRRESTPVQFYAKIVRPPDVPSGIELACVAGTLTVDD